MLTDRRGRTGAADHMENWQQRPKKKRRKTSHYSSRLQQTAAMCKAPFVWAVFIGNSPLRRGFKPSKRGETSKPGTKKANWMIRLGDKGLFIRRIYKMEGFATLGTSLKRRPARCPLHGLNLKMLQGEPVSLDVSPRDLAAPLTLVLPSEVRQSCLRFRVCSEVLVHFCDSLKLCIP